MTAWAWQAASGSDARLTTQEKQERRQVDQAKRRPGGSRPVVYLHIGEPKTGTTFVQQAMWGTRATLAAQGVVLPGFSDRDHFRASRDLREVPRPDSDPGDSWAGDWDVLAAQALRVPGAAVISNELLGACNDRQASRAVRSLWPADVHVIVTVRDIASLLPAEWQEAVKTRGTVPWEQWLDGVITTASDANRRRRSWFWTAHDTLAILEMWSQHVPPDQVHVVTVPQHGPVDALWTRFASVLGAESGGGRLPETRVNSSLGPAEAEFLRRFNETLPDEIPGWFYTHHLRRVMTREGLRPRPAQARLALPPGAQAWAKEQSEILVTGLSDGKYHIVGDLDDLRPAPPADPYVPFSDLTAEVLEAAVAAAATLANRRYQEQNPGRPTRRKPRSLRQRIRHVGWIILNGPGTKRVLRNASHHATVRRLRVVIWRILVRPARFPLHTVPAVAPLHTVPAVAPEATAELE
jgi:hypothetical protein